MKLILMKQTITYLAQEAQAENESAITLLDSFDAMEIVEKEKYFVLTDKIITDETS